MAETQMNINPIHGQINIPREVRLRLIHNVLQCSDIDFFTIMLLCDGVEIQSKKKFVWNTIKRSAGPALFVAYFASNDLKAGLVALSSEITALYNERRQQDRQEFIQEQHPLRRIQAEANNNNNVNWRTAVSNVFSYGVVKVLNFMIEQMQEQIMLHITQNVDYISRDIVHFMDDPTFIWKRVRFGCHDVWKMFYEAQGTPFNGQTENAYLENHVALATLWDNIINHYNLEGAEDEGDIDIDEIDFDSILPTLARDSRLTFLAVSAFATTQGLGKGFLSYIETIVRKKTPTEIQNDSRLYIAINKHGHAIIDELVLQYVDSFKAVIPPPPARPYGVADENLKVALKDIAYSLCSGIFYLYLLSEMGDCTREIESAEFIYSASWVYNVQNQNTRHFIPITNDDMLKCTILKMYAIMLLKIPADIKKQAFEEWRIGMRVANGIFARIFPPRQDENDAIEGLIQRIRAVFIERLNPPTQDDTDDDLSDDFSDEEMDEDDKEN